MKISLLFGIWISTWKFINMTKTEASFVASPLHSAYGPLWPFMSFLFLVFFHLSLNNFEKTIGALPLRTPRIFFEVTSIAVMDQGIGSPHMWGIVRFSSWQHTWGIVRFGSWSFLDFSGSWSFRASRFCLFKSTLRGRKDSNLYKPYSLLTLTDVGLKKPFLHYNSSVYSFGVLKEETKELRKVLSAAIWCVWKVRNFRIFILEAS